MISTSELLDRLLARSGIALFLDYDGTLAEFAPTPDHVEPNQEVVAVLRSLSSNPRATVALISGRALSAVEDLIPFEGPILAGSYGLEVRITGGRYVQRLRLEEVRPFLDRLLPVWKELLAERMGFYLEDKGWSLAIHARFAEEAEANEVIERALGRATRLGLPSEFRALGGERFLEIAPRAANKREGVEYLLATTAMGEGGVPLYLGDDDKDVEAFPAIHGAGGYAALVGEHDAKEVSVADCAFDGPAEVRSWLRALAEGLS